MNEFKINKYLTLKLEGRQTNIYVNGKFFRQCKYLLLDIPTKYLEDYEEIDSIDEAAETLDHSLERESIYSYDIPPETEFWGHCSNMQAWAENDYDTRILHRNLAFVLLKELTQAGDPVARNVFKEEIAKRLDGKHPTIIKFLILEGYVPLLNEFELESLFDPPKKWLIESFIELLNDEFELYLEAFKKHGRKFQFLRKNEEAIPVITTVHKLAKFRNPKLLEGIFMESDIQSLLYLYLDLGFNDYYIQNYTDYREKITETLISGLNYEDKYIFGFSLEALVFYSYIKFTKWHRKTMSWDYYKRKNGIRVKNHLKEGQYEPFLNNIVEKLLKFHDAQFFNYHSHLVTYSEFFADFGNYSRNALTLLKNQATADLKQIAIKSLLIIEVEFGQGGREDNQKEIDIGTLKDLNLREIKVLIPEHTGKILVETIINQLNKEKDNRTSRGNARTIFRYVGEYHAIELGEGVLSILHQHSIELLDLIFQMSLFEYLTPEECVLIAEKEDLTVLMQDMFIIIQNRIRIDRTKNRFAPGVPFLDSYPYFIEDLCTFLKNLKGKLSPPKLQQIVTFLEKTHLELLPLPPFWNLLLKLHVIDPSVDDIVLFFKWYNVRDDAGLDHIKRDICDDISRYPNLPEMALEKILTQNDETAFRNAVETELLFKMGPSRLISLWKKPHLNFGESVSLISSEFKSKPYRDKYVKLLREIEELSSIAIVPEENFLQNTTLREELLEKDQLKYLEKDKFWKLFPPDIIKLREIEGISHHSFTYISNKYLKTLIDAKGLSFALKDDQLIFFSGAHCKLIDEQIKKIFKIIINFPSLLRISLNHNNFETLPEEIGIFKNLQILDLAYAGITSVPDSIGELKCLESLAINYNHLTALPNSIGNLTSLKRFAVNSINTITILPDSIGNLTSLETLSLSGNPLTILPDAIGNLTKLSRLAIEGCPLQQLPESIGNLSNLQYIHMADTKIQFLPDSMKNLKNLNFIQVSDFYMSDMPKLRALMKPLKDLKVRIGFENILMGNLMTNEIF